jgi:hypothetical protein
MKMIPYDYVSRIFCSVNRIIDGQSQLKMATEVDWDFKL